MQFEQNLISMSIKDNKIVMEWKRGVNGLRVFNAHTFSLNDPVKAIADLYDVFETWKSKYKVDLDVKPIDDFIEQLCA